MAIVDTPPRATGEFERASFTGSAGEYFGIWIVNVLLTIITIGIYSAWAKVRRKRYFYGNTVILGRAFEYHATGKQIFIGRIIVIAFLVVIQIVPLISPFLVFVVPVLVLVALPWVIKRSLRFNARVTSYRNVRFDFVGTAGGAFVSILLGGVVAFISFGILAPLSSRWAARYVFNNMRYGDRPFATDPKLGQLYLTWLLPAVMVFIGAVIAGIMAAVVFITSGAYFTDAETASGVAIAAFAAAYLVAIGVFILYAIGGLFYRIGVRNVVWSAATLDGRHQLMSDMSRFRYIWIAVSNVVVTMLTLGLMRPWAAVRMARYVNTHTGIRVNGDLGEVFSSIEATGAAISAEYMDMEGFDFGF